MQPTSAAFLRLLSFVFALIAVEFCASLSRWLVCNVHFDKFCPSTNLGVGRNVSVWVLNMVLFQNFFKVQCFRRVPCRLRVLARGVSIVREVLQPFLSVAEPPLSRPSLTGAEWNSGSCFSCDPISLLVLSPFEARYINSAA